MWVDVKGIMVGGKLIKGHTQYGGKKEIAKLQLCGETIQS